MLKSALEEIVLAFLLMGVSLTILYIVIEVMINGIRFPRLKTVKVK